MNINVTLGSGKAVHTARYFEGYASTPECGGNRAAEGYSETKQDVTCKKCIKLIAAREAAAEEAEMDAAHEFATEVGAELCEIAESVAPVHVFADMQSPTQGIIAVQGHGTLQGLIGDDGRGGLYAEDPYADVCWHQGGHRTVQSAATALARQWGFSGPVTVTVHREYPVGRAADRIRRAVNLKW